jgi:hypothetical protein
MKASKHEGAVLLTAIDYCSIRTAHMRQATVIDQIRTTLLAANTQTTTLRTALIVANATALNNTTTIDELRAKIATLSANLHTVTANLHTATTSSFEATFKLNKVQHDYNIVNADNNRLLSELQVLTAPTPSASVSVQAMPATSSIPIQTDPVKAPPVTSTSTQTACITVDASSQTAPILATDKPIPAAHLPPVSQPTSYAQATKANLSLSHALAAAHAVSHVTTATAPAPATNATSPSPAFKGRRGTKASEVHLQLSSRVDFNDKLHALYGRPIVHRHALKDAFPTVLTCIFKLHCRHTHKGNHRSLREIFRNNHIDATFWSPQGNLIIRAKKAIDPVLLELITSTVQHITGHEDSFVILHRPPLSMLKLTSFPTTLTGGQPTNPEQILMDLFDDP